MHMCLVLLGLTIPRPPTSSPSADTELDGGVLFPMPEIFPPPMPVMLTTPAWFCSKVVRPCKMIWDVLAGRR
jgi:hypothetical protein